MAVTTGSEKKLANLVLLKDYAVQSGIKLPEDVLYRLSGMHSWLEQAREGSTTFTETSPSAAELDFLIASITEFTFPVTINNVHRHVRRSILGVAVSPFLLFGLVLSAASATFIGLLSFQAAVQYIVAPLLAMTLGMLGAVLFLMTPNGRFDFTILATVQNADATVWRVLLGGILGFVLYLTNVEMFSDLTLAPDDSGGTGFDLRFLIPLIGGYSTTIVVGLLSKVVTAVEVVFDLDSTKLRQIKAEELDMIAGQSGRPREMTTETDLAQPTVPRRSSHEAA